MPFVDYEEKLKAVEMLQSGKYTFREIIDSLKKGVSTSTMTALDRKQKSGHFDDEIKERKNEQKNEQSEQKSEQKKDSSWKNILTGNSSQEENSSQDTKIIPVVQQNFQNILSEIEFKIMEKSWELIKNSNYERYVKGGSTGMLNACDQISKIIEVLGKRLKF